MALRALPAARELLVAAAVLGTGRAASAAVVADARAIAERTGGSVTVLTDPADYPAVLAAIRQATREWFARQGIVEDERR